MKQGTSSISEHISLPAQKLFTIGNFTVTNTILTAWVVIAVIIAFAASYKYLGKRVRIAVTMLIEGFIDLMTSISGDRALVKKYFPLVGTIFIFVLASNWAGILPGVGTITAHTEVNGVSAHSALFRSVFSDLNMTLALALIVVTTTHIIGLVTIGIRPHISKFITFKSPIKFFVGILELISEVSRIVSFSFRLFGNVFAGEVLMVIISFLVPYAAPIPFLGLELFTGLIQALIFSVLTMMFIVASTQSHEEHAEHSTKEEHTA